MKRAGTPTFVIELPLAATASDERGLAASFEAGRRLYNACLGEALRRLGLMHRSECWRVARAIPKTVGKKPNKERAAAFKRAQHAFGFTSAAVSAFGTKCKNEAGFDNRLGAHETQRIAERAFAAAAEFLFGTRGKPRFKGKARPLHSLESKTNAAGIRWQPATETVAFGDLVLPARVPGQAKDKHGYVRAALARRTKFCRLLWRMVKGRRRWFVQLMQEGTPPRKYETVDGAVVGIDIGPSSVAVVGASAAALTKLAPSVEQPWAEVRRLQRALDRSRRATNPHCYNDDGCWKRGARATTVSSRYGALRAQLAEVERVLVERRKRDHGALANRVLALGNVIQAEALSYKSFQGAFRALGEGSRTGCAHRTIAPQG